MAERVILHVGTKKTGTTYLQTVIWNNREALRRQGVLVPGNRRVDHLHAAVTIRGGDLSNRSADAPTAWQRVLRETRAFKGTAVISHENMGAATPDQVSSVMQALSPAEIHVVVTARDYLATFPALWQERVKFRSKIALSDFDGSTSDPLLQWGWPIIDYVAVLEGWGGGMPRERVHVIPVPRKGAPPDELWRRFASLLGVEPGAYDTRQATANSSLGVVEVELMRQVNHHLGRDFRTPRDVGRWLRSYLAGEVLAPRRGERFAPDAEQQAKLRARSIEAVEAMRAAGYDVIGDLDELMPPETSEQLRHPDSVTAAELADVGAATISRLLADLKRVSEQRNRLRARLAESERQDARDVLRAGFSRRRAAWRGG